MEISRKLLLKIAQEAHTMGRLYEKLLSPINPAIEYSNVEGMIDRTIKSLPSARISVTPDATQPFAKCSICGKELNYCIYCERHERR